MVENSVRQPQKMPDFQPYCVKITSTDFHKT